MATRPRLRSITTAVLTQTSVEDLSNNQVLLAVVTASLVGQILKPFTSALQGKGFNWRLVVGSGGMPSTHSACVTAACTSIALERGLADSLFGLSVVFAGIVMYDAQGVRRAVGKQAEVINTVMLGSGSNLFAASNKQPSAPNGQQVSELQSLQGLMTPGVSSNQKRKSSIMYSATDEQSDNPGENSQLVDINDVVFSGGLYTRSEKFIEVAKDLPSVEAGQVNLQEIGDLDGWRHIPLKESVGHTKLEVLVGGLWGVFSTLALSYFVKAVLVETLHS